MAEDKGPEKTAAVMATLAAVASGINLLKPSPVQAHQLAKGEVPQEVISSLQALAGGMEVAIEKLSDILTAISGISLNVQGYPQNCHYAAIAVINCQGANQAYQSPSYAVPDGFNIVIKSHPNNIAGSLVFWSTSPGANVNASYPLMPNEAYTIGLKNTGSIYVFTNIAGSQVVISVEQRRS